MFYLLERENFAFAFINVHGLYAKNQRTGTRRICWTRKMAGSRTRIITLRLSDFKSLKKGVTGEPYTTERYIIK